MTRLGKFVLAVAALGAVAAAAAWVLSSPSRLSEAEIAGLGPGDPANGERMFWAGGCSSCHARPKSEGSAKLELAGGLELNTPFGVFVPPNISPDRASGIGEWSLEDFANAMLRGVSPSGAHYYPAFPYASYARMKGTDVADLFAYLKTLPPVAGEAQPNRVAFPFNFRRGLGLWKVVYLNDEPIVELASGASPSAELGRYLVEGPAHCGECHTPRDLAGGMKPGDWLAGAAAAEGAGNVPNVTSGDGGIGHWSEADIASFLETGFTPEFDSAGGPMAEVIQTTSKLPAEDRTAIAAYLKAVPPRPNGYAPRAAAGGEQ